MRILQWQGAAEQILASANSHKCLAANHRALYLSLDLADRKAIASLKIT